MIPRLPGPNRLGRPPEPAPSALPVDLREWAGESTLVGWVLEAVCERLAGRPLGQRVTEPEEGEPLPTLLTVLTYCYATARYGSDEIETLAATDRRIRHLCASQSPTSNALRRCRRVHRALLRSCLLAVHRRAWRHRFGMHRPARSVSPGLVWWGLLQEETFDYRRTAAAEARIQQAVLADTMALDV